MDVINRTLQLGSKVSGTIKDGWENVFTGLGIAGKDKRTGANVKRAKMFQAAVEILHDADDIAKKVVWEIPSRATSKWIDHKVDQSEGGMDIANDIISFENELEVKKKFKKAMAWGRLYGGAMVFVSVDDGLDLVEPLNFERIVKVNSLTVLHRYELHRGDLNTDINDPNFGLPETFRVSGRANAETPDIHHSRLIRFDGSPLSEQEFKNNDYWADSVLNVLHEIIRDYNSAYNGVLHALQDFDVSILKLKNLADIVGGDDEGLIVSRMKLMNLSKSILGSILIDAEDESFEYISRQFSNVDKVLEKIDQRLVMATGLPHTIVLGEGSTGGLNGGGKTEDDNINNLVSSEQDEHLKKPIEQVNKIIQASKQGPTNGDILETHSWTFNPLSEPSQKEVAETRELTAKADDVYMKYGALSPNEVAESRFGGDEYSIETTIDDKARKEQADADKIPTKEQKKLMEGINPGE